MATTFCTNHLRQAGVWLVKGLRKKDRTYLKRFLQHGRMIVLFVAGAAAGAVLCRYVWGKAVWGASVVYLIVFLDLLYADLKKEKGQLGRVPSGH